MVPDNSPGRRSRAALRDMLLEAGLELLAEEGLGLGAEQITYKRVFDRIHDTTGVTVTRGSVHDRIWSNQRDFQIDLLRRAAQFDLRRESDAIGDQLMELLEEASAAAPNLADLVREACRLGAVTWIAEDQSDSWELWLSVWAMFTLNLERQPVETAAIADEVKASIERVDANMRATIQPIAEQLGVRPRRETMGDRSLEEVSGILARFANALAEGTALRRRLDPNLVDGFLLPTGPDGELQDWTLGGLGAWLMTEYCFDLG